MIEGFWDSDTEFLDTVGSTNSYLMERAAYLTEYQSVATSSQTLGRGRLDRRWISAPGLGLAMSVALPATPGRSLAGVYPLVVGSVVLDAVREAGVTNAELKWPNDIMVRGKKLAGILCEVPRTPFVIAGVGINVSHSREQLPLPSATSFFIEGVVVNDWKDFARLVAQRFKEEWARIPEILDKWDEHWENRLGTLGRKVFVDDGFSSAWEGEAIGLDGFGRLLVRSDRDGVVRPLSVGDIQHLGH